MYSWRTTLLWVAILAVFPIAEARGAKMVPVPSPQGNHVWHRGNCLIAEARRGGLDPRWNHDTCDFEPVGDIGAAFGWVADFLVEALNVAERSACGSLQCAFERRAVRFIVTWGQVPELEILPSDRKVSIYMTTALVQLIESTAAILVRDANAGRDPSSSAFVAWLERIANISGQKCSPVDAGHRPDDIQHFHQLRAAAQVFYVFTFSHEVAHQRLGPRCGAPKGMGELHAEALCDQEAFQWLADADLMLPGLVILPYVALGHYQAALDPLLGQLIDAEPGTLTEKMPAARWRQRARLISQSWEERCAGLDVATVLCPFGWTNALSLSRRLVSMPLPSSCVVR